MAPPEPSPTPPAPRGQPGDAAPTAAAPAQPRRPALPAGAATHPPGTRAADFRQLAERSFPARTRNGADVGRTQLATVLPDPHREGGGAERCTHGVPRGVLCAPCATAYAADIGADDSSSDGEEEEAEDGPGARGLPGGSGGRSAPGRAWEFPLPPRKPGTRTLDDERAATWPWDPQGPRNTLPN